MMPGPGTVVVTMAFRGCHAWVRRAVDSILGQTRDDLLLVLVNDADPVPPWDLLADIDDERLVRFDLARNRGRYFIDAVIFEALRPSLWALQDPDDMAVPERFARMAPIAQEYGAAFAPTLEHAQVMEAPPRLMTQRLHDMPGSRMHHHVGYGSGVISGDRIRSVGGFHPGLRICYDTYLMNVAKLIGPWRSIDTPLQHKVRRREGLTGAPTTGYGSDLRVRTRRLLEGWYERAHARHQLGMPVHDIFTDHIPPAISEEVLLQAARLRALVRQEVTA